MKTLTKYESFLSFFSESAAYQHAAKRIKNLILSSGIVTEDNLLVRTGAYSERNYMDCSRLGINITVFNDVTKFKYIKYFNDGNIVDNKQFVYAPDYLRKEMYIYLNECTNDFNLLQKVSGAITVINDRMKELSDTIDKYKFLLDKGYKINDIFSDNISEVFLRVSDIDAFIHDIEGEFPEIVDEYRKFIIDMFKANRVAHNITKVNSNYGIWVLTPHGYKNNKEIVIERDKATKIDERYAEILAEINDEPLPCRTFKEVVEREG